MLMLRLAPIGVTRLHFYCADDLFLHVDELNRDPRPRIKIWKSRFKPI
jgi:hypothetical protein